MLVDSALRERIQMATVKRERPIPPASVSAIRETPADSIIHDIPWSASQAVNFWELGRRPFMYG
jgi:hypothetical protein